MSLLEVHWPRWNMTLEQNHLIHNLLLPEPYKPVTTKPTLFAFLKSKKNKFRFYWLMDQEATDYVLKLQG